MLRGALGLRLVVRERLRLEIVESEDPARRGPPRVTNLGYFYELSAHDDREVLAFHWTPSAAAPNAVTLPHLHIGPAIVAGQTTIRPRDLHKAHVPTGVVSLAAVVRLAIAEFGVVPLRAEWDRVLRAAAKAGETAGG